jgi:threonine/homoserine/homoserine lactone efflux protein
VIEQVLFGSGFALAAALQPGPLQAFLFSQVAQKGWRRTVPAAFSPLLSDGPIALVVLLILKRLPPEMGRLLQLAGGILLLYLGYASWRRSSQAGQEKPESRDSAPRTLMQAAAVNILNPNPYLAWSLILGPRLMRASSLGRGEAAALIVAFYGTMVLALAVITMLFGMVRLFGRRSEQILVMISTALLAGLGAYQLFTGLLR